VQELIEIPRGTELGGYLIPPLSSFVEALPAVT
jgi:hypothetical protein